MIRLCSHGWVSRPPLPGGCKCRGRVSPRVDWAQISGLTDWFPHEFHHQERNPGGTPTRRTTAAADERRHHPTYPQRRKVDGRHRRPGAHHHRPQERRTTQHTAGVVSRRGRQLADRRLGRGSAPKSRLVQQRRHAPRPGADRDRGAQHPGHRRATPRRRAREGVAGDHFRVSPLHQVSATDRPGVADHPADYTDRGGAGTTRRVRPALHPMRPH